MRVCREGLIEENRIPLQVAQAGEVVSAERSPAWSGFNDQVPIN